LGLLALKKESIRLWPIPSGKLGRRLSASLAAGSDGTPLEECRLSTFCGKSWICNGAGDSTSARWLTCTQM